jgi:DNA-binding response OmpR family regulator
MGDLNLSGRRILIVEDEYLLADDLRNALAGAGAEVLGPVPSVGDAEVLLASSGEIDAAVLDINLRGEPVFPFADTLRERGVPFAFATGYDRSAVPERFADTPRVEKPFKAQGVATILGALVRH